MIILNQMDRSFNADPAAGSTTLRKSASLTSEAEALTTVIADIYDAALDPDAWPVAMRRTCDFVGGAGSTMFWHDAAEPHVTTLYNVNDDPHYTQLYVETYGALNPLFPAAIFQPVGSVNADSDLVPDEEMRQTRFYKEWLKPQNVTGALAALVEREATRAAFLAVQWKGRPIDQEGRRRFTMLVPHFQRAVVIGRLFVKHRQTEAALTKTLDHVEAGVFLVAADGRLVFANARGQRMLETSDLLQDDGGRLRTVAPESDRALSDSLRSAAKRDVTLSQKGVVITLSNEVDSRWTACVLPLVDGARRRTGKAHEAVAAVFVRNSTFPFKTPVETLAALYELTASEIKVVEAMLRMSGLDAIASALGISRATVKTHLNRIYRKCRARNQSDLIKLIAGLRTDP